MKQNLLLIFSVIILVAAIYYHLNKKTVNETMVGKQNDTSALKK